MTETPQRPQDPPSAPLRRALSWEYQLHERNGFVERFLGVLTDLWRRSRTGKLLAFLLAPLWLVALVLVLAVAFAVGMFILALVSLPVILVGYGLFALVGSATG